MKSYRNDKLFMKDVEEKRRFDVKSALVSMLYMLDGDKVKIEEAIKYAKDNDAFKWEEHDNDETKTVFETDYEKYCFEKERLVQNFSKIRYDRVMELLKKVLDEEKKQREAEKENEGGNTRPKQKPPKLKMQPKREKKLMKLVTVGIVAIAVLILMIYLTTKK